MSSTASTSSTIVKRGVSSPVTSSGVSSGVSTISPPTSGDEKSSKCECCPYGIHIDLGFVTYAQNVSNGFVSRQGTPTNMNPRVNGGDRQLMSPLGNSVFSDSLDNLLSDFDDVLAPHKDLDKMEKKFHNSQDIRNRMQTGYHSDYTTYRRGAGAPNGHPPEPPPRRTNFEPARPNPISRPMNLGFSGSRSNTPTLNGSRFGAAHGNGNGYSTALAKTVSEIRARNSESPFPDSRVSTPIDLGVHHTNGGSNGFYPTTPSRFNSRHDDLPPTPTPTFRRVPSQGDLPRGYSTLSHTPSNSYSHAHQQYQNGQNNGSEFASLRRGREYSLPDEQQSSRVRFFSASPKLPRRLQAGPSIDVESHFTYAQGLDGQRVLARTQSTSTSPPPTPQPKNVTRSVAVSTGPLPAPKPCGECAALRKELFLAVEKMPPPAPDTCHVATSTIILDYEHKSVGHDPVELKTGGYDTAGLIETKDTGTVPQAVKLYHVDVQTEKELEPETVDQACSPIPFETRKEEATVQTDVVEPEVREVVTSSLPCEVCLKRQDVFTRNVGVGACSVSDKICVNCDKQVEEIDENEAPGFKVDIKDDQKQRDFEIAKANAVKKLLTNEQKSNFQRGTAVSKSARYDRKKAVDDLDYIVDKKKSTAPSTTTSEVVTVPENSEALKSKVVLKKEVIIEPAPSKVPEPVPARIPRPKISKWASPEEAAETPDEEEEAQDRLTPLRSELRVLGNRWPRNHSNTIQELPFSNEEDDASDSDAESDCSAHSDATFEVTDDVFDAAPFEVSDRLREALENFNSSILEPNSVPEETVEWSAKLVRHEWLKAGGRRTSRYEHVDRFVEELKNLGPAILNAVVNLADVNGNTALHYAVSHANFPAVSSILDSGAVDLDIPNKAGYTAVMLAALSQLEDDMEKAVIHRLFQMGDVNAKASQHGQTALMLAVSHGKKETTELLLSCGADVNLQDEEGSTALMCAAEHGHRDIVKMLLGENNVNASLTDCVGFCLHNSIENFTLIIFPSCTNSLSLLVFKL
uniref:ANK_REP_REGION domain-containing protein n=1 Tax=Caenorhabditis japonica TaxID=281687 RepID=A0A8R1DSL8_CAEJA